MPGAAIIHAAVFTAGALVGGGIAAAVSSKRNVPVALPPPLPVTEVVRIDASNGRPRFSGELATISSQTLPPALLNGNPGPVSDLLVRRAYAAGYDRRLRHPSWTAEHITKAKLARTITKEEGQVDRSKSTFVEDESIPKPFRARLQDYFRSGYDRGHMVPAADAKISQEAMDETFLLSNIAPQVGDGFNRHYWAYLEEWCRRLTNTSQDVYVFTVPLYLPKLEADGKYRVTHEVIGSPPNISVPTHFAKVVMTSKPSSPSTPDVPELALGAFVLPNAAIKDEASLESFVVPVEAVERAAGLTLFSDQIKSSAKHICKTTKCEVIVRRFDDARKNTKAIGAPKK